MISEERLANEMRELAPKSPCLLCNARKATVIGMWKMDERKAFLYRVCEKCFGERSERSDTQKFFDKRVTDKIKKLLVEEQ